MNPSQLAKFLGFNNPDDIPDSGEQKIKKLYKSSSNKPSSSWTPSIDVAEKFASGRWTTS